MQRLAPLLAIAVLACGRGAPRVAPRPAPPAGEVGATRTLDSLARGAALLDGLGSHQREVTTSVPLAQTYFDQGLRLLYAFHLDEAARSFAKGAALDPACAMCLWGVTYALGPDHNVPMLPERFGLAWEALGRARKAAAKASPVEQALIGALAERHQGPTPHGPVAQQAFNERYAAAMREVARQYPDDLDVQVLTAAALMELAPWRLWTKDGKPGKDTEEILGLLESVLARNAEHPGANHYYIHAVETSSEPQRALASAERLPDLVPGAGHLVHMPARVYQRVGRYADASAASRRAIEVDEAYLAKAQPIGHYPLFLAHSHGFLAYTASMEGRAEEALAAARRSAKAMPPEMLEVVPGMDYFAAAPLLVMVRFGKWDQILAEPRPAPRYHALTGLWLHARGMALAGTGRLDEATADLAALERVISEVPPEEQASMNPTRALLAVGARALAARIAEREGRPEHLLLWAEAVALEDQLAYAEPAAWFYPMRHLQGAALLGARRYREAALVFRKDLEKHPRNGWSLFGLAKALEKLKRKKDAARVVAEFDKAWTAADITLSSPAF